MKFVTFVSETDPPRAGILSGQHVYPLPGFADLLEFIRAGDTTEEAVASAVRGSALPLRKLTLLAPLPSPPRIFCIGLNYASHAAESQMKVQAVPTVFMKLSSSVTGPNTDVVLPSNSTQPDYEAELAVVMGTPGYRIPASEAMHHVFGYTILNDISARDVQLATSQWTLGKSFPTFCPLGPALVTKDDIADPHALDISLSLSGEEVQTSNTRHLIFRIPQLIEYISSLTPLVSGDIISTGTPEGVGMGRTPPRWLRSGDEIIVRIAGMGELRNRVVAEGREPSAA